MKKNEVAKKRAKELRAEGYSIGEISKILSVSKGNISPWVKNIILTPEAEKILREKNPATNKLLNEQNRRKAVASNKIKTHIRRTKAQEDGANIAKENTFNLHLAGCMLYWAEGSKYNNRMTFCNSDVNMLKLFTRFLRECYAVPEEKITIRFHAKTDFHNEQEIEYYWRSELNLFNANLGHCVYNYIREVSGKRKRKLQWGICTVEVSDWQLIQNIYGGIKEYGGFENELGGL